MCELLLSYQRNSVWVFGDGNGGDERGSGWFWGQEGQLGGMIVGGDGQKVVVVELVEVEKQFRQISLQVIVNLMDWLTEFGGDSLESNPNVAGGGEGTDRWNC